MQDNWKRLAGLVNKRRVELGISKREAIRRAKVGNNTWLTLENDGRPVEDHLWSRMAAAIEWTPDSFRSVLDGGEPTPADADDIPLREIVEDLRRRVERLEKLDG